MSQLAGFISFANSHAVHHITSDKSEFTEDTGLNRTAAISVLLTCEGVYGLTTRMCPSRDLSCSLYSSPFADAWFCVDTRHLQHHNVHEIRYIRAQQTALESALCSKQLTLTLPHPRLSTVETFPRSWTAKVDR